MITKQLTFKKVPPEVYKKYNKFSEIIKGGYGWSVEMYAVRLFELALDEFLKDPDATKLL